jgi:hypothetical protein
MNNTTISAKANTMVLKNFITTREGSEKKSIPLGFALFS